MKGPESPGLLPTALACDEAEVEVDGNEGVDIDSEAECDVDSEEQDC